MELEAQGKDKCRQEGDEQAEEQKRYATQWRDDKGLSYFRGTVSFKIDLNVNRAQRLQQPFRTKSRATAPSMMRKLLPEVTGSFFQEG